MTARRRSSNPTPSHPHPPPSTPPRLLLRSPACSIHPRPLPAAPRPLGHSLNAPPQCQPSTTLLLLYTFNSITSCLSKFKLESATNLLQSAHCRLFCSNPVPHSLPLRLLMMMAALWRLKCQNSEVKLQSTSTYDDDDNDDDEDESSNRMLNHQTLIWLWRTSSRVFQQQSL